MCRATFGIVLSILMSLPVSAQSNAASGELRGRVTDASGALMPSVRVTVTNELTSDSRTALTGELGEFRLLQVTPGDYSVQFEKDQFKKRILGGVRVTVGQIALVGTSMEIGNLSEVVEVLGATELIEPGRVHQASTLEKEAIENLPIGRRDYLTFALLTPGIVDTGALGDNADFRPKQTPNSGLSVYGSNGRGNAVTVDGGEANDAGGGIRSTISQEAVQEFQINRSNYSVELGGATGAVINIVSKSGSNEIHGTVFGFFRDDALDAADPFARVISNGTIARTKPPAQRQQFGGSIGMPLRKDRTFLFSAFEGLVRDESSVTSLLTDPAIFTTTPAQEAVLNALPAASAGPLRAALTTPQSTIDLFTRNSGVFPYITRSWKASVRLDHIAGNDRLFFRHNFSRQRETNANLQALFGASRGNETYVLDPTTVAGWTHISGPNLVNSLAVQWNYRAFNVSSAETLGPELRIAGYGIFNRDIYLPSRNIERRTQFKDNLTYVRGSHTLKAGGEVLIRGVHSDSEVLFGGRFTFGTLPGALLNPALPSSFTINALQAYNLGLAQTYFQAFGTGVVSANNPYFAAYVEDSWRVASNLTLNTGLRYEIDFRKPPIPTGKKNFAPRVGFAWDPTGDRKTAVRGGYGIFYAPIYFQTDWVVNVFGDLGGERQVAQLFTTIQTAGPAAAHNVFRTLTAQGVIGKRAIAPTDLAQFGVSLSRTGPLPPLSTIFQNSPDYRNPYSQQASLSIDRELASNTALSVGYTFSRTLHIARTRDANLLPAPVNPALGIRVWSTPYFVNPLIAQRGVYESTARAFYHGMVVELTRRFGHSFSFTGNYTLSKAIDEVVDFTNDYVASDEANLRGERALSSFDQRHKLVLYGMWDAPGGIKLSPVLRANSARPFNLLVGFDLNQDRHDTSDRPPFAGRSTGVGPDFWTFDLRAARAIPLGGDDRALELMIEGFNLFNRLNFASINNIVGVMAPPFRVQGREDRSPSQPLGFTSAYEARKIQLGVRLKF